MEQHQDHFAAWEKALCAIPEEEFVLPDLHAVRLWRLRQRRTRRIHWAMAAAAGVLIGSMTFTFAGWCDRPQPPGRTMATTLNSGEMSFAWDRASDVAALENTYREIRRNARWEIPYELTDKEIVQ